MSEIPHPRPGRVVDVLAREALRAGGLAGNPAAHDDAVRRCRDALHGDATDAVTADRRAQRLRLALLFRAEGRPAGAVTGDDLAEVLALNARIDHTYSPTHDHRFDDLGEALR